MADGRHLGKIEKSPYLGRGLTDFDKIWHGTQFGHIERSDCQNLQNLKIQDGGGRRLEKLKNCYILAVV